MKLPLIFIILLMDTIHSSTNNTRKKRSFYLLFPPNAVLQFTYGLSVPLVLPRRSINLSWGAQSQYNLPRHVNNFQPTTIQIRKNTEFLWNLSRVKFYQYFAKILDNFGFHGKQCIFRSICEIAEIPMYKRDDTILEKIIEFLFTPSLDYQTNQTETTKSSGGFVKKLLLAEKYGKSNGNCEENYSKCLISIIDLITALYVTE